MNLPIQEIRGFYHNGHVIKTRYYDDMLLFSRKGLLEASNIHSCPYKAIYRYQNQNLTAYKIGGNKVIFFNVHDTLKFLDHLGNYALAHTIRDKFK